MKRFCAHPRLIVAILMVLVLGLQFVNALSSSHTGVVHRHAGSSAHIGKAQGRHDHAPPAVTTKAARAHMHAHQHDPGDHSHDLPLRQVLAVVQFSFMPVWHSEAVVPLRSALVHRLERPPKPAVTASSIQAPATRRHAFTQFISE